MGSHERNGGHGRGGEEGKGESNGGMGKLVEKEKEEVIGQNKLES